MVYCKICDKEDCSVHHFTIGKTATIKDFSGSSPPEVFVGSWNYPRVYAGILSPQEFGDTSLLSSPEKWHEKKLTIPEIVSGRQKLIYGRAVQEVKKIDGKFLGILQEIAMTHKSVAAEYTLKKPIAAHEEHDKKVPLIANAGEIEQVRLQENVSVKPKIEYLVNDVHVKAANAITELDKTGASTTSIIKLLSAGLLGLKKKRKLVPTKWSITAVDDMLSKERLKRIKELQIIEEVLLFHAEFLGNHYEFLLLPGVFSFEVIEISLKNFRAWQDFESFEGRKSYANDVTGAYYANRLALTEYLERINRQAQCLVIREIRQEYDTPLGVGILRQTSREAFVKEPEHCENITQAQIKIQRRLKLPLEKFTSCSKLLKDYTNQKKLKSFL